MKKYNILMISTLIVILNSSIPMTWANKKTAIIAAGIGSGVVTLGGAAWHYFFNKDGTGLKLEFTFNGESSMNDEFETESFFKELKEIGFDTRSIQHIEEKISDIINKSLDKEAKTKFSFFIRKGYESTMDVEVLKDSEIINDFRVFIPKFEVSNGNSYESIDSFGNYNAYGIGEERVDEAFSDYDW